MSLRSLDAIETWSSRGGHRFPPSYQLLNSPAPLYASNKPPPEEDLVRDQVGERTLQR